MSIIKIKHVIWVLLALMLALSSILTLAQEEENTIEAGQTVTGTINNDDYFDVWRYASPGNERINVRVETTGGDLDTSLAVITAELEAVGISDDIDSEAGNYNSAVTGLTIPYPDTVLILVTRFATEQGTSAGSYSLRLTVAPVPLATAGESELGSPPAIILEPSKIQTGPEDAWQHLINKDVIPDWQGSLVVEIPDGATLESQRTTPFTFLVIGKDIQTANVIMHSNITWRGNGDTQACGLVFRKQPNGDAYTVYLGKGGWLDFGFIPQGQTEDWFSIASWDVENLATGDGNQNDLLVTAVENTFSFFVNYELIGAVIDDQIMDTGQLYISTLRDDNSQVNCNFGDYWVIEIYP